MEPKILFICKHRSYGSEATFGLFNSASFVAEALRDIGIQAKVVVVVDNNEIDREVHKYKPTHVIIEALWVVPSKFKILMKLHPKVRWIVRIHSKLPFLATEGIAIEWIREYSAIDPCRVEVAGNSSTLAEDFRRALGIRCISLPNIYSTARHHREGSSCDFIRAGMHHDDGEHIDIGCFGAIRPLKNHLSQAFAAIRFADLIEKKLRFHINASRVEQKGEQVLKNMRALFPIRGHKLVEHPWLEHHDFIKLVKKMDMGMQVSFTESYNIVTADFVSCNIPIVVSPDITWMPWFAKADPNSTCNIAKRMESLWCMSRFSIQSLNLLALNRANRKALKDWKRWITHSR